MSKKNFGTFFDPITGEKVRSGKVYGSGSDVRDSLVAELPVAKVKYDLSRSTFTANVLYDAPELGKWYHKEIWEGKFRVDKKGRVYGSIARHYQGQYARIGGNSDLPSSEKYYEEAVTVDTVGRSVVFSGRGDFQLAASQFVDYDGLDFSYSSDGLNSYYTDNNSGASVPRATDKGQFSSFGASRFFGDNWWVDMF